MKISFESYDLTRKSCQIRNPVACPSRRTSVVSGQIVAVEGVPTRRKVQNRKESQHRASSLLQSKAKIPPGHGLVSPSNKCRAVQGASG